MIKCSDLIGKKTIGTYYEFLFCMALAAECGRRGDTLDMRDIQLLDMGCLKEDGVESGMLSSKDIGYMHYLRSIGSLEDGSIPEVRFERGSEDDVPSKRPDLYFEVSAVTELYDVLVEDTPTEYLWVRKDLFDVYGAYGDDLLPIPKVGNTIMHIAAHLFMCFKMGEREVKPVRFHFKGHDAETGSMYIDLLAGCRSLPYLSGFSVTFDEDYLNRMGDIDFSIVCSISNHAGRHKKWDCDRKFKVFRSMGWKEGSILVLYKRSRVSASNDMGTINSASIIRIDKINDKLVKTNGVCRTGWEVTEFAVDKSKNEIEADYLGIAQENRHLFSDMLSSTLKGVYTFYSFDSVGIGTYFYDEEYLFMPLDSSSMVSKLVTVDGKKVTLTMNEVEAVYWLLREYGVEFDYELYKKDYNNGNPLKWDMCDPTPLITAKVETGKYSVDYDLLSDEDEEGDFTDDYYEGEDEEEDSDSEE